MFSIGKGSHLIENQRNTENIIPINNFVWLLNLVFYWELFDNAKLASILSQMLNKLEIWTNALVIIQCKLMNNAEKLRNFNIGATIFAAQFLTLSR